MGKTQTHRKEIILMENSYRKRDTTNKKTHTKDIRISGRNNRNENQLNTSSVS